MIASHGGVQADARAIFDYLYVREPPVQADVIVGFGHFDPKIPQTCGELYCAGYAARLLFTGGVGAGTADLRMPEADYFLQELAQNFPQIPRSAIALENASTNTMENLHLSTALVQEVWPHGFGATIKRALLVATAYRQRRVALTWQRLVPGVVGINTPPVTTFGDELAMFAGKGQDLIALMAGEVERLVRYSASGWIAPTEVPPEIAAWAAELAAHPSGGAP